MPKWSKGYSFCWLNMHKHNRISSVNRTRNPSCLSDSAKIAKTLQQLGAVWHSIYCLCLLGLVQTGPGVKKWGLAQLSEAQTEKCELTTSVITSPKNSVITNLDVWPLLPHGDAWRQVLPTPIDFVGCISSCQIGVYFAMLSDILGRFAGTRGYRAVCYWDMCSKFAVDP